MATPKLDLAGIKERMEKATPGPWKFSTHIVNANRKRKERVIVMKYGALAVVHCDEDSFFHDPHGQANAAFIAASRTDIELLVAEVERLEAAMKHARVVARNVGGQLKIEEILDSALRGDGGPKD